MELHKIVLTGGPCAGKTTALSWIQNSFTKRGYRVLFISETATELIGGGVAPWTCGTNQDYQMCQVRLQLEKEAVFEQAARTMTDEKILIVCDRGALDNKAYMNDEEWENVMDAMHTNTVLLRDTYDAVFHMVTAAKGAEEAYTLSNNAARYETPEEARTMDERIIAAWTGHPHLRIIDNSTDFKEKLERLISEITSFLGEPDPYEIERKYLIRYPDIAWLEALPNCQKVEIIQTYLKSNRADTQIRVRQRGRDGHYIYFRSEKKRISPTRRIELEKRLTQSEYLSMLLEADTAAHPIRKTRYCLADKSRYYEIDIYPQWKHQAIMELELRDENEQIEFPEGIEVIREVTDDERYRNSALARNMLPDGE
jgi:CYTH domain-containing protein/thymidylate kinase